MNLNITAIVFTVECFKPNRTQQHDITVVINSLDQLDNKKVIKNCNRLNNYNIKTFKSCVMPMNNNFTKTNSNSMTVYASNLKNQTIEECNNSRDLLFKDCLSRYRSLNL